MKIQMSNNKTLTQIPVELEHALKCMCNQNCTLDEIANTLQDVSKRMNLEKDFSYKGNNFREKKPFRVENKDKLREKMAEVTKKKNYCHNCGSTDHYANRFPKAKKKMYSIEKVPEEEIHAEGSESDSMNEPIREKFDDYHDKIEQFLVNYQEETPLEI
ncbi:hypothetical protein O181_053904 [Austropuccinia psidii MF-1]|uniref:Uncharacterized protein n=1 Tax=Austropuccinia psidii MF-1 TaxID=1389203 RepID=A0A9Q3E3J6_9BASI|nr:hypothetical protein [Austropuccinia psidii MF-1]